MSIIFFEKNREFQFSFFFHFESKSLPFKAHFAPGGDQVFTVTPNFGELLPESEEGGTLMQIGFIPNTYGKVFESELIITVRIALVLVLSK